MFDDCNFTVRIKVGDSRLTKLSFLAGGGVATNLLPSQKKDRTGKCVTAAAGTVCVCVCVFMGVDRCLMFCSQSDDSRKKPCSHRGHYASY